MKPIIKIPSEYGKPVFEISFDSRVGGKYFPKKSMPTAKEILLELGKFVEVYFFIISEISSPSLGQFQSIWAKDTIVFPRKSKKDDFCFVEKIDLEISSEKRIQQLLNLAKRGFVQRIIFSSPVYTEEIVYCYRPLWPHFPTASGYKKSLFGGDVRIGNKISIVCDPLKEFIFSNDNYWAVVVLDEKWSTNYFKKAKFCFRESALKLVTAFLEERLDSGKESGSQISEIIASIEKIEKT